MALNCKWLVLFISSLFSLTKSDSSSCNFVPKSKEQVFQSPEIFWVNMDKSNDRRMSLSAHLDQLGWLHRRVKGLSLDDIYIPADVRSLWDQYDAKVQTNEVLLDGSDPQFVTKYGNASHFLIGLVGRGKTNRLKELGCTISHLEAMRQAIYNNRSSSKYAVITEDDIYIPFEVDFQKLAEAAPADFGILQLFNSNEESMESVWKMYRRDQTKHTFVQNRVGQAASFWSTCAYLINREMMKPAIDEIIFHAKNVLNVRIIAGIRKPCRPKLSYCCVHIKGTYSYEYQERPPCFLAPKGFQADSFIYALNRTYVLTTPLITNGAGGNQSTFHQDHVEYIHQSAFRRQRQYINDMIADRAPLPPFVKKSCMSPLPLQMELKKNNTCWYSAPDRRSISIFWLYIAHENDKQRFGDYVRNVVGREAKWLPWIPESALYIPPDLASHWETRQCRIQTTETRLQYRSVTPEALKSLNSVMKEGYQVAFAGLCGRGRHHTQHQHGSKRDLAATVTHLLTLYHARKYSLTDTRYAIISSGDVFLALNPKFEALVASAPEHFGFLTFLVDDDNLVDRLWQEYIQNSTTKIWSIVNDKYIDHVSSQFYIVNLDTVGPILEAVMQLQVAGDNGRSLSIMRLIAGGRHIGGRHHNRRSKESTTETVFAATTVSESPDADTIDAGGTDNTAGGCYPKECCGDEKDDRRPSYCILSHGGSHRAEALLWKLATTYTLHIPIVLRGTYDPGEGYAPETSKSSIDVAVNEDGDKALTGSKSKKPQNLRGTTASTGGLTAGHRQRQIINAIQDGQVPLPSFLLSTCSFKF